MSQPNNNLPFQLTGLVGRRREISEVGSLLSEHRLLTLTGSGGSGKTRLALAVAFEVVEGYEGGAWLVELAPLSDPELVARAVASVLGVREAPGATPTESLADHLGSSETLLVLDNCEHLVGASASLAEALLRGCPNLRILATSREALGVTGETIFAVPALSLPDPRRLPAPEGLTRYEATGLFVQRARAVRPGFSPTEDDAVAVAQICYRLDGIPLAIELAAARAKALSVEQIASRLDDRFGLLTGGDRTALPHQRTLGAAMDWSHELLSEEERALFRRLSVFAGGFALEAAEAVGAGERTEEAEVLDLLASLVDKSMVLVTEQDGDARYSLLETVRQYGWEKLQVSGEAGRVRRRHADYYLKLAEGPEPDPGEQGEWLRRLGTERDNFRAVLQWSLRSETTAEGAELGLRLAAALGRRFWAVYGLSEGLGWLEKGLAGPGRIPESVRAEALSHAGWIASVLGEHRKAVALLDENFVLSKELGDRRAVAASLVLLGQLLAMYGGEHARVEALRQEAETLRPYLADRRAIAPLLVFLGLAALDRDDYEETAALLEEGLSLFRELGDLYGIALSCGTLGFVVLHQGDVARAAARFEEALRSLRDLRDRVGVFHCFLGAASVTGLRGEPGRAAQLWGAAEALGETAAVAVFPVLRSRYDYEGYVAAARSQLGEEAFTSAWSEGRTMSPEQAIEYALQPPKAPGPDAPAEYPAGLSGREVEVLVLAAAGMTNARIAKELFISPRTVNRHLGSVYRKVGVGSRAAAARFASEHGLL